MKPQPYPHISFRNPKPRIVREGFTLIEILVVIVIIALLAAIVTPVISNSLQKARTTKTLSNLKQIGYTLSQYQLENQKWPPVVEGDKWWSKDFLYPLLYNKDAEDWMDLKDTVFVSPNAPRIGDRDNDGSPVVVNPSNQGFGMNVHLPPNSDPYSNEPLPGNPLGLRNPASTMVLMDCNAPRVRGDNAFRNQYTSYIQNRHDGKNVILYADNHVSLIEHEAVPVPFHTSGENSLFWRGHE
jgi:prepilin-type N-terminal cleavage/methylation domain-containing protein/prepilin-type processing-associated H-X9-DG protein